MRKYKIIIFIFIAVVGIGLRVIGIGSIQPVNSDESSYLRQARFMVTVAQQMADVDLPVVDESENGIWRYLRRNDWSEKPCWLHTGMVAGAMLIGGVSAMSGVMVNILFSLGTVLVVFFLTRRLRGVFAAIISALLLSVSGYWLIYSRSNWAEIDGVFFVTLAAYLLVAAYEHIDRKHYLLVLISGICGGLAVLCHYRLLYIIGPLGLFALLIGGRRRWFINGVLIVAGYAGIILSAAAVIRLVADGMGGDVSFSGLLEALRERFMPPPDSGHVSQTGLQPMNSLVFLYYLLRNQGLYAFVLMLVGIISLIKVCEHKKAGIGIVILLLTPLAVLSMQKWVVARAAVVMVPFACITAGVGASAIWAFIVNKGISKKPVVVAAFGIFIFVMITENLVFDVRVIRNKAEHNKVTDFLAQQNPDVVYVDPESEITYGWFNPDLPYRKLDLFVKDKNTDEKKIFVVFDAQKYHASSLITKYYTDMEKQCAMENSQVFKVDNIKAMWKEFLMDGTQANSLKEMLNSIMVADGGDITSIRIYKIND